MLAIMLIAQITVISAPPPLSPEEAVRVLRASRSPADMTDVHLGALAEVPGVAVRSSWRPGDGPFGPFDDRLTHDYVRRGIARSIHGYAARGRLFAPIPVIGPLDGSFREFCTRCAPWSSSRTGEKPYQYVYNNRFPAPPRTGRGGAAGPAGAANGADATGRGGR